MNPMSEKIRQVPGEREEDTCDHSYCYSLLESAIVQNAGEGKTSYTIIYIL